MTSAASAELQQANVGSVDGAGSKAVEALSDAQNEKAAGHDGAVVRIVEEVPADLPQLPRKAEQVWQLTIKVGEVLLLAGYPLLVFTLFGALVPLAVKEHGSASAEVSAAPAAALLNVVAIFLPSGFTYGIQ